uniref:Phospholipase A I-like n=1 Tax=Tanacetum cinerariifolium TaxID=118510 RepID=A0A699HXM8_TANCI|nr:phospholipase A I-like [Tanacetum cinerariifolium]
MDQELQQVLLKLNTNGVLIWEVVWQAIRVSLCSSILYYLDDYSDGVLPWQDGAIVANNPTIFAIREEQIQWRHAKIDTLVSVGCYFVPKKAH